MWAKFIILNTNPVKWQVSNILVDDDAMNVTDKFRVVLSELRGDSAQRLRFFALLNLGVVQSLSSGVLSAPQAARRFYNAENCLYVRKQFRNRKADAIMSHGVQLPDLFDALSADEASREFLHELEKMRTLCMDLLQTRSAARAANRVAA